MEQWGVPLGHHARLAAAMGGTTHVRVLAIAPVGREQHLKHTPTINIYGSGGWEVFDWWFGCLWRVLGVVVEWFLLALPAHSAFYSLSRDFHARL